MTATEMTFAQRQELVVGYMDNKGCVCCPSCGHGGLPMLAHMLASPADECDLCSRRLVSAPGWSA